MSSWHHCVIIDSKMAPILSNDLLLSHEIIWKYQNYLKGPKTRIFISSHLIQVPVISGILCGHENGEKYHISTSLLSRRTKFCRRWMITRRYKSPTKHITNFSSVMTYFVFLNYCYTVFSGFVNIAISPDKINSFESKSYFYDLLWLDSFQAISNNFGTLKKSFFSRHITVSSLNLKWLQ